MSNVFRLLLLSLLRFGGRTVSHVKSSRYVKTQHDGSTGVCVCVFVCVCVCTSDHTLQPRRGMINHNHSGTHVFCDSLVVHDTSLASSNIYGLLPKRRTFASSPSAGNIYLLAKYVNAPQVLGEFLMRLPNVFILLRISEGE